MTEDTFRCDPYGPPSAYTCPAGCEPYTAIRLEEYTCTVETLTVACVPDDEVARISFLSGCFHSLEDPNVSMYAAASYLLLPDGTELFTRYWEPCPPDVRVACRE